MFLFSATREHAATARLVEVKHYLGSQGKLDVLYIWFYLFVFFTGCEQFLVRWSSHSEKYADSSNG
jgi:hypothetical protein